MYSEVDEFNNDQIFPSVNICISEVMSTIKAENYFCYYHYFLNFLSLIRRSEFSNDLNFY